MDAEGLSAIQEFIDFSFPLWKRIYGSNLVGVHIGNKRVNGIEKNIAIIFHVSRKFKNPSIPLPSYFSVKTSNNSVLKIPTDVVNLGTLKLEYFVGSKTSYANINNYGSLGFYLSRNGSNYFCSNMHVLGTNLLKDGRTYYYKDSSIETEPNIFVLGQKTAILEEAYFDYMDIAIAQLPDSLISNFIPNYGTPKGYRNINRFNINGYLNKDFLLYGAKSGFQKTKLISIEGRKVASNYGNTLYSKNLLIFEKCSYPGDSGAPIFDPLSLDLLGICIGSDMDYTYAIPIEKILNRFNAQLLT